MSDNQRSSWFDTLAEWARGEKTLEEATAPVTERIVRIVGTYRSVIHLFNAASERKLEPVMVTSSSSGSGDSRRHRYRPKTTQRGHAVRGEVAMFGGEYGQRGA